MKLSEEIRVRLENGASLGLGTWIAEIVTLETELDAAKRVIAAYGVWAREGYEYEGIGDLTDAEKALDENGPR